MTSITKNNFKYTLLTLDELIISLERLSRFKLPEETFSRVFYSIITKHLIYPKFSKKDIELIDPKIISDFIELIWNSSVNSFSSNSPSHDFAFNILRETIINTFSNIDERTNTFINTNLVISPILTKINYESAPNNLRFLIKINKEGKKADINKLREKNSLCFPVKKLLIVEGVTEEILLPVFADKLNKNFNKSGVFIIGAGGKSKSPSLYIKLRNRLKIPVILLFDKDAKEICCNLKKILRGNDKIIIIEKGEFEDILPVTLIKRALNKEYTLSLPLTKGDLLINPKMCENIETFYRNRHLGEFKKSAFAKIISQNIKYENDISEDIKNIINSII